MMERDGNAIGELPGTDVSGEAPARRVLGIAMRGRRRQLGLTLAEIGRRSGLSIGFLSQVERGLATPSPAALTAIAKALGVVPDYFLARPPADAATRADARKPVAIDGGPVRYEPLSSDFPGQLLSAVLVEIPPGFRSESACHDGEEIVFVLEGTVTCAVDGRAVRLCAGDSLHLRSGLRHAWRNPDPQPVRLLWAGTDRTLPPAHRPAEAAA